jgi:hypothetical protein
MKTTFIYTLSDSNGQVRYVGKSNNPNYRFKKHLIESKKAKTYKEKWINTELSNNRKIFLDIIDEVENEDWSFWESYWISQFITWGFNLVNGTSGGEGSDGFKGKKHSLETIKKIKSYVHSEKARKIFSESIIKRNISRRIILNIETGIYYLGIKEANNSLSNPIKNLCRKLNGTHFNDTKFIYV